MIAQAPACRREAQAHPREDDVDAEFEGDRPGGDVEGIEVAGRVQRRRGQHEEREGQLARERLGGPGRGHGQDPHAHQPDQQCQQGQEVQRVQAHQPHHGEFAQTHLATHQLAEVGMRQHEAAEPEEKVDSQVRVAEAFAPHRGRQVHHDDDQRRDAAGGVERMEDTFVGGWSRHGAEYQRGRKNCAMRSSSSSSAARNAASRGFAADVAEGRLQPPFARRHVGPADHVVVPQQRQRVVAELALRRRRVGLELVGPAPQQLEAPCGPTPRGSKGASRRTRVVGRVAARAPGSRRPASTRWCRRCGNCASCSRASAGPPACAPPGAARRSRSRRTR